jgi:hypothetical protein
MSDEATRRDTVFANIASWICIASIFVIPIGFKFAFTSPYLPESRDADCDVLLLFVAGQLLAVALGVVSFIFAWRKKWSSILARSICGIVIGCIAAVIMALFALSCKITL